MDERTEQARVSQLIQMATVLRWNRRQILKRAAIFGLSAPAISAVLAACGGDDDDEPTATEGEGSGQEATEVATEAEGDATEMATEAEGDATEMATEEEGEATEAEEEPTEAEATEETSSAEGGGTILVATDDDDTGVGNPILIGTETWIEDLVFSRLVFFQDDGVPEPDLAESWEFSEDGLTATFNLVEATWHDGEPFTADDVIFTFDAVADPNTETNLASNLRVAGEFMTWEAPDDRTIVLTMTEPFAGLIANLANVEIVPKHLLEGEDINTASFNANPVGTGAFRLTEWTTDQFIQFERYEDYFKGPALAEGFTMFYIQTSDGQAAAFDAGDLDLFFTTPEMQARYEDSDDAILQNYVYFTSITLAFNHKHPILAELAVREAIETGIDKDSWTQSVTRGRGIVSYNQYAESGPLDRYNNYDDVVIREYDAEAAATMLTDLGWVIESDGVRAKDGERMSFNVITYSGFDEYQNGQVILQDQMSSIGVEITPVVVDFTTLEEMWADPEDDPNNRALELEEWPHPKEFDPDVFGELHSSNFPPGLNYMWWANDETDALVEEGRVTLDFDERTVIYQNLDVVRSQQLPAIPLYLAVDGYVTNPRLLGADGEPFTSQYFRWGRRSRVAEMWKQS